MNVSLTIPLGTSENTRVSTLLRHPSTYLINDHKTAENRDEFATKRRIRINVRGIIFETFQATLEQFPDTLLGSPVKRLEFYDSISRYYFFDRDPAVFDSILFYYQSGGILARPESVPQSTFNGELEFFGIQPKQVGAAGRTKNTDVTDLSNSANQLDGQNTLEITGNNNWEQRVLKLRQRLWLLMEYPQRSYAGKIWVRISISVIVLSVISFCLETIPQLSCSKTFTSGNNITALVRGLDAVGGLKNENCRKNCTPNADTARFASCNAGVIWFVVETSFVLFFLIEYSIRIFSAPSRCNFILSLFGLVDAAAIAPYFVTVAVYGWRSEMFQHVTSFSVLRAVRLFRVLRVFKLSRYSEGLKIVGKTFRGTWRTLMALMLSVFMTIIVFTSFILYAEDKDAVSSMMEGSYLTVITMTTVGYGDVVPQTVVGKLLATACMLQGIILLFIMPLPVFVTHFNSLYEEHIGEKRQQERLLDKLMAR